MMSRQYVCDQCGEPVEDPISVDYPVFVDDDEDADEDASTYEEAHLCGYGCLATWAVEAEIDTEPA